MREKRVLGIDPGFGRLGVAIMEFPQKGKEKLVFSDCLATSPSNEFEERLSNLANLVGKIVTRYKPEVAGVEKIFFSNNQKTAVAVAEVRGAIIFQIHNSKVPILHLTPLEIKMAITGYGRATKNQVETMVEKILSLDLSGKKDDEVDAIAIALATGWRSYNLIHNQNRLLIAKK